MSQSRTAMLRLESFAGGLNDTDPPHRIGDDQLVVATDVELNATGGVVRRSGAARVMAQPATALPFRMLQRHTPANTLASTEAWAFSIGATNFYRNTASTTWGAVALSEAGSASNMTVTDAASFNGKLYIAYKKAASTDRLHAWDGTSIRRVGVSTPAAPTAGNTGVGSYAATVRYYKVQFFLTSGGTVTFSDLSTALTFTPSGTGTHARITKPATPDGATSWRVWASADNVSYYLLAEQVVGTTTVDDNTAPSAYAALPNAPLLPPEAGAFTPPWSAKYLLVDDNRLLIAGAFETTRYASRVGWSPVLGVAVRAYGESAVVNDDERIPTDNYLDLDSDEGGELTGMELLNGSVYVFKRYAIYKLIRTGNDVAPYKPVPVTKVVGAVTRKSIVPGEDEGGNPCLYFLSERGPYRLGVSGLQYLGADIETLWTGVIKRGYDGGPHGIYDPRRGQVRWWVVTSASTGLFPDTQIIFHVKVARQEQGRVRGGWTTTASTSKPMYVAASAMLPDDLTSRDSELSPHAIHWNGAWNYQPVVWKYTHPQASDDTINASTGAIVSTESFSPVITTKTFSLGMGDNAGVMDTYVACTPTAGGTTLSATLSRNFGASTATATKTYTGTTTRQPLQISDLVMSNAQYISLSLTSSTQQPFVIDEVAMRVKREEPI